MVMDIEMSIETPRCILRPATSSDLSMLEQALGHPGFPARLPLAGMLRNGRLANWLDKMSNSQSLGQAALWSIDVKHGAACIGQVGCFERPSSAPALSFWLAPGHWGKGFAREAVAAFLAALADKPEFDGIWASTAQWNVGSQNLLAALGFELIGNNEDGYLVDGQAEATREYQWQG